jgi:LPS O-antigen subunit length determinant protein (WzzB/FepE family)
MGPNSDVLVIAFFLVIVIISFYQIFSVIILVIVNQTFLVTVIISFPQSLQLLFSYSSLSATYLQKATSSGNFLNSTLPLVSFNAFWNEEKWFIVKGFVARILDIWHA